MASLSCPADDELLRSVDALLVPLFDEEFALGPPMRLVRPDRVWLFGAGIRAPGVEVPEPDTDACPLDAAACIAVICANSGGEGERREGQGGQGGGGQQGQVERDLGAWYDTAVTRKQSQPKRCMSSLRCRQSTLVRRSV